MTAIVQFLDRLVPYNDFLKDVGSTVVAMLKEETNDPEFISQRKAFAMFGRRNVERWRRFGLIEPIKRPGRVEYKTSQLRLLQRNSQDYLYK